MPVSWAEAIDLVDQSRQYDSVVLQRMMAVRAHYNADVLTPTYDVPGAEEPVRSPNPLLIADAIDGNAMRASSIVPSIEVAGGKSDIEQKRAFKRKGGLQGVWHASGMKEVLLARAFRHFFGYGTYNMIAVESDLHDHPIIQLRDPLTTYSESKAPEDFSPPRYVAYVYGKSASWIVGQYPETKYNLFGNEEIACNDIWDVVEYIDGDQIMIGVMGQRQKFYYNTNDRYIQWRADQRSKSIMLRRYVNKAGMVPAYTSRRVTLDRIESSVMKLTGLVNEIGYMRTLEKIAAERGTFPDLVAFGDGEEAPYLVNGNWQDGRDGQLNVVENARGFQTVRMDPSQISTAITDRMQGSYSQSGGLDPLFNGEARGASLRTGRAVSAMAGFSLDPTIQESQNGMARALAVINTGALELWRGAYGDKKISMYTGKPADTETIDIRPSKDITNTFNLVNYPIPGADITSIQVALGQAMQTDQMSKKTARAKNPLVENEEFEERQLYVEAIDQAMLAGIITQAQNPQDGATLVDLAEIKDKFAKDGDIGGAVRHADQLARERQANAAPDPTQQVGGLEPQNPGASASPAPQGFAAGPSERGNQLQRLTRNLNSRPSAGNRIPSRQ